MRTLMIEAAHIRVVTLWLVAVSISCAAGAEEFNHAPVVYKPTTSTESLMDR